MTATFWRRQTLAVRILGLAVLVEILVLLASIPHHTPDIDEAWFAEEAWFRAVDGYPHSNFFKGYVHEDVRVVVHHWLFIAAESIVFRTVGFGLDAVRIVPVVSTLLILVLLAVHAKRSEHGIAEALLAILALLLSPQAFRSAKLARPDMLVTLFGFASFLWLRFESRVTSMWRVLAAGACAGAAMLTHLNGVVFVAAGAGLLLGRKRFGDAAAFLLAAVAVFSPYVFNAAAHWDLFKEQLQNPLIAYKTRFTAMTLLVNLSREHMRLFRKPDIIFLTLLFMACLAATWRRQRFLSAYACALALAVGALLADKGMFYSVYLVPFEALVIARALVLPQERHGRPIRWALAATACAFAAWGAFAQALDLADKTDLVAMNREIGGYIPRDAWTVAPMQFAFDELPGRLLVADVVLSHEKRGQVTARDLADSCDEKGARYAVLYRKDGFPVGVAHGERLDRDFHVVREDPRYVVLRRR